MYSIVIPGSTWYMGFHKSEPYDAIPQQYIGLSLSEETHIKDFRCIETLTRSVWDLCVYT